MRISTTTLESFRLFLQQDRMLEADLIATIAGAFVPTPAVLLGQAFGQVLETPERYAVPGGYVCGAYQFGDDVMAPAFARIDRAGVFEAKAQKRYGVCDVVAKADHQLGAQLSEFKTTTSTFDFDKYAHSYQWQFMVDIFEPALVTYHVFLLEDHGTGVVALRGIETFNLFPYADLHADCCALLHQFTDYVTVKSLDAVLRTRQLAAAE